MGISQCLLVVIEGSALGWCAEHDLCAFGTHLIHEYLQLVLVVIPGSVAGLLLLLVIMSELHEDVIAFLQSGQNLVQTKRAYEGASCQSALRMVTDSHLRAEPACNHLSPRCPRLVVLIHYGRVAAKVEGGYVNSLYMKTLHSWHITIELQRQSIVPSQVSLLTVFDLYTSLFINLSRTFVDHETHFLCVFGFLRGDIVHHQSSAFCTHRGVRILLAAQHHFHQIVAIGHLHAEIERLRRFLTVRSGQYIVSVALCITVHGLLFCHVKVKCLCGYHHRHQGCQSQNSFF